ncbi:MAG: hypothetical protein RET84_02600 [Pseudomonadota bacterium]|nr:hypothetical protein [Pseudomonadota bacterium]
MTILQDAALAYERYGDQDSDLRDAPEYLVTVSLAQGLTEKFPMLMYRLEHHASAFDNTSRSAIDARAAVGKDAARFDIVLLNRHNNVPRCIIEVKRGPKIVEDAKRIISIAALESGRPRWRHGYLVTILRRTEDEANRLVDELAKSIRGLRDTLTGSIAAHQEVKVAVELKQLGRKPNQSGRIQLHGVVFHLALVDRVAAADFESGLQDVR